MLAARLRIRHLLVAELTADKIEPLMTAAAKGEGLPMIHRLGRR